MYDITNKLGLPTVFIRYNPDNKESDKNILLDKIKYYLGHEEERMKIKVAGRNWANKYHTYDLRFQELFNKLGI